ncbi:MAG: thioredoxin family protein [Candidatus Micrarchaeota archaeon]
MRQQIHWSAYAIALVITALVFAVGILLGVQLNQQSSQQLLDQSARLTRQSAELEVLSMIGREGFNASAPLCELYHSQARTLGDETASLGYKLTALEAARGPGDENVAALKSEYSLLEIRDYLFAKEVNRLCGGKLDLILYFYSNTACQTCKSQGEILSSIRKASPQFTLVYSFDAGLQGSAALVLKESLGVRSVPSIVANGRLLEGFQEASAISAALQRT